MSNTGNNRSIKIILEANVPLSVDKIKEAFPAIEAGLNKTPIGVILTADVSESVHHIMTNDAPAITKYLRKNPIQVPIKFSDFSLQDIEKQLLDVEKFVGTRKPYKQKVLLETNDARQELYEIRKELKSIEKIKFPEPNWAKLKNEYGKNATESAKQAADAYLQTQKKKSLDFNPKIKEQNTAAGKFEAIKQYESLDQNDKTLDTLKKRLELLELIKIANIELKRAGAPDVNTNIDGITIQAQELDKRISEAKSEYTKKYTSEIKPEVDKLENRMAALDKQISQTKKKIASESFGYDQPQQIETEKIKAALNKAKSKDISELDTTVDSKELLTDTNKAVQIVEETADSIDIDLKVITEDAFQSLEKFEAIAEDISRKLKAGYSPSKYDIKRADNEVMQASILYENKDKTELLRANYGYKVTSPDEPAEFVGTTDQIVKNVRKQAEANEKLAKSKEKIIAANKALASSRLTKVDNTYSSYFNGSKPISDFDDGRLETLKKEIDSDLNNIFNSDKATDKYEMQQIDDKISRYKALLKLKKDTQYAATSLTSKDIQLTKNEKLADLDINTEKWKQAGVLTGKLSKDANKLYTTLSKVTDVGSLQKYTSEMSVISKHAKEQISLRKKADSILKKSTTTKNSLEDPEHIKAVNSAHKSLLKTQSNLYGKTGDARKKALKDIESERKAFEKLVETYKKRETTKKNKEEDKIFKQTKDKSSTALDLKVEEWRQAGVLTGELAQKTKSLRASLRDATTNESLQKYNEELSVATKQAKEQIKLRKTADSILKKSSSGATALKEENNIEAVNAQYEKLTKLQSELYGKRGFDREVAIREIDAETASLERLIKERQLEEAQSKSSKDTALYNQALGKNKAGELASLDIKTEKWRKAGILSDKLKDDVDELYVSLRNVSNNSELTTFRKEFSSASKRAEELAKNLKELNAIKDQALDIDGGNKNSTLYQAIDNLYGHAVEHQKGLYGLEGQDRIDKLNVVESDKRSLQQLIDQYKSISATNAENTEKAEKLETITKKKQTAFTNLDLEYSKWKKAGLLDTSTEDSKEETKAFRAEVDRLYDSYERIGDSASLADFNTQLTAANKKAKEMIGYIERIDKIKDSVLNPLEPVVTDPDLVSSVEKDYRKLITSVRELYSLSGETRANSVGNLDNSIEGFKRAADTASKLQIPIDEQNGLLRGRSITEYKSLQNDSFNAIQSYNRATVNPYLVQIRKQEAAFKAGTEGAKELNQSQRNVLASYEALGQAIQRINALSSIDWQDAEAEDYRNLEQAVASAAVAQSELTKDFQRQSAFSRDSRQVTNLNLLKRMESQYERFGKIRNSDYNGAYVRLMDRVRNLDPSERDLSASYAAQFAQLNLELENAGLTSQTLIEKFKELFSQHSEIAVTMLAIEGIKDLFREMYAAVVDVDSAMTELKKVTNESEATYSHFLDTATKKAKILGGTISDVVNSTADMVRSGYGIEDATMLAEAAITYKNVGDGIEDIDEATESIISSMKAFGIEAEKSMDIVNKYNEVGNNFSISSQGIGQALLRSASALSSANNTIDESIALATAANEVVQDPDVVGTALKTISMRLRNAKGNLEAYEEDAEGAADSITELQSKILDLTNNRVNIMADNETFKSTYAIMVELSKVWDTLTDVQQAEIVRLVAGVRQGNVFNSMMQNMDTAINVVSKSLNSQGSAVRENEKYLDSINGRASILMATFQELAINTIDSELIKGFFSLLTVLLEVTNAIGGMNVALIGLFAILGSKGFLQIPILASGIGNLMTRLMGTAAAASGAATAFKKVSTALLPLLVVMTGMKIYDALFTSLDEQMEITSELADKYAQVTAEYDKLIEKRETDEGLTKEESARLEYLKEYNRLLEERYHIENSKEAEMNLFGEGDFNPFTTGQQNKANNYMAASREIGTRWENPETRPKFDDINAADYDTMLKAQEELYFYADQVQSYLDSGVDAETSKRLRNELDRVEEALERSQKTIERMKSSGLIELEIQVNDSELDSVEDDVRSLKGLTDTLSTVEGDLQSFTNLLETFGEKSIVTASDLNGLDDSLKGLSGFEEFSAVAMNSNTSLSEFKTALNNLVTEYLNNSSALGSLTAEEAELVTAQLKAMGVTNAKSIVDAKATENIIKEILATNELTAEEKALYETKLNSLGVSNAKLIVNHKEIQAKIEEIAATDSLTNEEIKAAAAELKELGCADSLAMVHAILTVNKIKTKLATEAFTTSTYSAVTGMLSEVNATGTLGTAMATLSNVFAAAETAMSSAAVQGALARIGLYEGELKSLSSLSRAMSEMTGGKVGAINASLGTEKERVLYWANQAYDHPDSGFTQQEIADLNSARNAAKLSTIAQNQLALFKSQALSTDVSAGSGIGANFAGASDSAGSGGGSGGGSDSGEDEHLNAFEEEYELLKHRLAMEYITEKEYFESLTKLNNKYFKDREEYISEYRKYLEEIHEGGKTLYQAQLKESQDYIDSRNLYNNWGKDNEIDAWKRVQEWTKQYYNDGLISYQFYSEQMSEIGKNIYNAQKDAAKEALDAQKELLDDSKDDRDSALNAVTDLIDDQIDALNKQKEAIEEVNDEKERALELERLEQQLAEAKEQRNKRIYREGQGFVWEADQEAVTTAENELNDFEVDEQIRDIEDQIDAWQDYKDAWNDVVDDYDEEQDRLHAIQILGADWEQTILNKRLDAIEKFRDEYFQMMKDIEEINKQIDDFEENYNKDVADGTANSGILSAFEKAANAVGESLVEQSKKTKLQSQISDTKKSLEALINGSQNGITDEQIKTAKEELNQLKYLEKMMNGWDSGSNKKATDGQITWATNELKILLDTLGVQLVDINDSVNAIDINVPTQVSNNSNNTSSSSSSSSGSTLADKVVNTMKNTITAVVTPIANIINSVSLKKYATGGVNTSTGLAQLDGTPVAVETIFNAADGKKLYDFVNNVPNISDYVTNKMLANIPSISHKDGGVTLSIGDIHLHDVQNVEGLSKAIVNKLPNLTIQNILKQR